MNPLISLVFFVLLSCLSSFYANGTQTQELEPTEAAEHLESSLTKINDNIKDYKKKDIKELQQTLISATKILNSLDISEEKMRSLANDISQTFSHLYQKNHHWAKALAQDQKIFEDLLWTCIKSRMFYIVPIFFHNEILEWILYKTKDEHSCSVAYHVAAMPEKKSALFLFEKIIEHWKDDTTAIVRAAIRGGLGTLICVHKKKLIDFSSPQAQLCCIRIGMSFPNFALTLKWLSRNFYFDILKSSPLYNFCDPHNIENNNIFQLLSLNKKPQIIKEILQTFDSEFVENMEEFQAALVKENSDGIRFFCPQQAPEDDSCKDYLSIYEQKSKEEGDEEETLLWQEIRALITMVLQKSQIYEKELLLEETKWQEKALEVDRLTQIAQREQAENYRMREEEERSRMLISYEKIMLEKLDLQGKNLTLTEEIDQLQTKNSDLLAAKKSSDQSLQAAKLRIKSIQSDFSRKTLEQSRKAATLESSQKKTLKELSQSKESCLELGQLLEEVRENLAKTTKKSLQEKKQHLEKKQHSEKITELERKLSLCEQSTHALVASQEENVKLHVTKERLTVQAEQKRAQHELELKLKEISCQLEHAQKESSEQKLHLGYLQSLIQEKNYDIIAKHTAIQQLQASLAYYTQQYGY